MLELLIVFIVVLFEIVLLVFCVIFFDIGIVRLVMLIRCVVFLVNDEKCIVYR